MKHPCNGCIYWRCLNRSQNAQLKACHYCIYTGQPRGCSADNCTRKTTKRVRKRFGNQGIEVVEASKEEAKKHEGN